MGLRRLGTAAIVVLVAGLLATEAVEAGTPVVSAIGVQQLHGSPQPGNRDYHKTVPSTRYRDYPGQYPWYGTVWGVPTYNWGNFGAKPRNTCGYFRTYYWDNLYWHQSRRY